jgi:hypothetical protein
MFGHLSLDDDAAIENTCPATRSGHPRRYEMDPLTAYDVAKLRMAERHEQASRERQAKLARATRGDDEHERSVWRRWTLRRLVGRITLANAGA